MKPWLEGKVVGGLIGMVTKTGSVSVTDSSASTVIRADGGAAGGLIGAVYHAATITDSYADCYLRADRTGGLIAKAEGGSEVAATGTSITLKDFYAAGYQTATVDAFGLVGGSNVIAKGGYSACVYNVEENAKVHSTVKAMGSASNVYYLTDGGLSGGVKHQAAGGKRLFHRENQRGYLICQKVIKDAGRKEHRAARRVNFLKPGGIV